MEYQEDKHCQTRIFTAKENLPESKIQMEKTIYAKISNSYELLRLQFYSTEIYPEKSLKIHNPGMAPPYLYDCKTKKYLAQLPAILMHLGKKYDYLPKRAETLSLA